MTFKIHCISAARMLSRPNRPLFFLKNAVIAFPPGSRYDTVSETRTHHQSEALEAYDRGLTVLTAFLVPGGVAEGAYLWAGMQTFHYGFHLFRAACLNKLGRTDECPGEVARAYEIVSTAWSDFAENTDYYMENFFETLDEYGLNAYKR